MRNALKPIIQPGILSTSLTIFIGILLWGISAAFYIGTESASEPFLSLHLSGFFFKIISILLTLSIGFLLSRIIEQFTIIRTRTFLPTFFFVFILVSNPSVSSTLKGLFGGLILLWTLWEFMPMYQDKKSVRNAFNVLFIISIGSWAVVELLYFIPVLFIGFIIFQSFSLRTLSAGLIGLITPFLLALGALYIWGNPSWLIHYYTDNWQFVSSQKFETISLIYFALLMCLYIIAVVNIVASGHQEKIKTRKTLYFLILLYLTSLFICVMSGNQWTQLTPIAILFYVPILSHFFSLKTGRFVLISFWVFIFSSLFYYCYLIFFPL